jgi:LacI family transcriptional regulator
VRAASERLGYRTNEVARALRRQSTGTVGMVVPQISNPFFPAIVEAVERGLGLDGVQLLLCDSQGTVAHEASRLQALLSRRVDGLLIIPCETPESGIAVREAAASVPVVQIDRTTDADTDYVGTDDSAGVDLVLDHLRQVGAGTFAFVSATATTSSAAARHERYRQRTAELDPAGEERCLLGRFSFEWGQEAATRLLQGPLPDAIVCGADIVALGLLSTLHARGVAVPGDVLVTGYDDIGFAGLSNPGLTTVRQPVGQLGHEAVRLLQARLRDPAAVRQQVVLQPTLVVRESTVSPRAA